MTRVADDLPAGVREAFGVPSGPARRLPGGGGSCWQVAGLVLKPGHDEVTGPWLADVFAGLSGPGFRVPRPVPTSDGAWLADGWAAWTTVEGEPDPLRRWPDLVAAARAFPAAVAGGPAPPWLGRRRHRWAVADRVAWEGAAVRVAPELADLAGALRAATRPVRLPSQLVHGDLAGNMLFTRDTPPAVIDFSPYRRPAGYALAVAAVDLLTWWSAPPTILDTLSDEDDLDQLLVRATMFRLVSDSLGQQDAAARQTIRHATEPVVDLVLSRRPR